MNNRSNKTVRDILGRDTVHPFPARMAPGIALDVVAEYKESLCLLDPMSGSGTVLAVARANGHSAIGVDMDPLAVLISKVWTTPIDPTILKETAAAVFDMACRTCDTMLERDAYMGDSDLETRQFIRFWFDGHARRQLTSLAKAIKDVHNEKIKNALWCAFSRLIITKKSGASLAMDLSHSRPHKVFERAPVEPFHKFLSAVEHVANNCVDSRCSLMPETHVCEGDARDILLKDGSVDLVLTSPPYLNAIDYMRCSKFTLVWMGYSIKHIRNLRSTSIGAEVGKLVNDDYIKKILAKINPQPKLHGRCEAILMRYIDDMRRVIRETARVLVDDGQAIFVIGENTMRGTFIRNSLILEELAKDAGFLCISRHSRELPPNRRYLPPPTQSKHAPLDARMRHEVVLTLKKTTISKS